jgi:hypothetical protein
MILLGIAKVPMLSGALTSIQISRAITPEPLPDSLHSPWNKGEFIAPSPMSLRICVFPIL